MLLLLLMLLPRFHAAAIRHDSAMLLRYYAISYAIAARCQRRHYIISCFCHVDMRMLMPRRAHGVSAVVTARRMLYDTRYRHDGDAAAAAAAGDSDKKRGRYMIARIELLYITETEMLKI